MKYFHPINVQSLNRIVWLNPSTFEHTADNLVKMKNGKSPIGIDGKNVNLHHIGRKHSSNLATLTDTFHRKASPQIHNIDPPINDKVNRKKFRKEKRKVWQAVGQWLDNACSNG
jgi:hypothetical protein